MLLPLAMSDRPEPRPFTHHAVDSSDDEGSDPDRRRSRRTRSASSGKVLKRSLRLELIVLGGGAVLLSVCLVKRSKRPITAPPAHLVRERAV